MITEAMVRANPAMGKVVGKLRINKSYEYTDAGYECAAWWEKRAAIPGVYDLTLGCDPYGTHELRVHLHVPATVVEDFFPALFCGVSVGKPYDCLKNKGNACRIYTVKPLHEVLKATGSSQNMEGCDWALHPDYWQLVVDDALARMRDFHDSAPEWWAKYDAGDNEFDTNLGMVSYMGEGVARWGRIAQEAMRHIRFQKQYGDHHFARKNLDFLYGEAVAA